MSKFSVKRPYTIFVSVIIVLILGVVSYLNTKVDLLPNMNIPYAVVITSYPGATPEMVEETLSKPIENTLYTVNNISEITSSSAEHMSIITLEFNSGTNMDSVALDIREQLDLIESQLPKNAGTPMVMKLNPDMMPVMSLAVSVDGMDKTEATKYINDNILTELNSVEGVASINTTGLIENYLDITINYDKLNEINKNLPQEINISSSDLEQIISSENFSMPAGMVNSSDGKSVMVRVGDKFENIEEIKNLELMSNLKLSDFCDFTVYDNSNLIYSKIDNNYGIMLSIQKQSNYSISEVSNNINDVINDTDNVHFQIMMDQGEYISLLIGSIVKNIILGALFAVIILYIFLRKIKPTLIVSTSIIISVISTFVLMYFANISMNMMSMGGIAIGIGMLVDNSIVVIENIFRLKSEGKDTKNAAIEGAKEVSGAIVASTLTTVVVFLPILFTTGITKELFMDMALTIGFSLFASLIVALTLVPAIASVTFNKGYASDSKENKIADFYEKVLKNILNKKSLIIIIVIVLFVLSIFLAFNSGVELFPEQDSKEITLNIEYPSEYNLEDKYKALDNLYEKLEQVDNIETIGIMDSSEATNEMSGLMSLMEMQTTGYVTVTEDSDKTTALVTEDIRNVIKDLDIDVSVSGSNSMMIMTGGDIVIDVYSDDLDSLQETAKNVFDVLNETDGVVEIESELENLGDELRIIVDKNKAISNGLSVAQVYMSVADKLKPLQSDLTLTDNDYITYIKTSKDEEFTIDDLKELKITNNYGQDILITDVADILESKGFATINRSNKERYTTVSATLKDGYSINKVNEEIDNNLKKLDLEDGTRYEFGGEQEQIIDIFTNLFLMLALAIVFIYLVMVAQFQSLLSPFIIMFTIPLAFTGGFLGLFITNTPISAISLIGLLVLVGIVVNNGIVYVDYTNQLIKKGENLKDALIHAGKNRIRPILMTALTTIIALIMMAIDTSSGAEMMKPLAITAIGGLIYATILTLVLIPVLYYIMHNKKSK